jgi:glycosyltransferase involved in cell wall biosynthesis
LCAAQAREGAAVAHWTAADAPRGGHGFRETFRRPAVATAFATFCERFRPDVVHFHHLTGLSLDLPGVAKRLGATVVFTLHDPWLVCARGQWVDAGGARCVGPDPDRCAACLAPALWAPLPLAAAARLPRRTSIVRERVAMVEQLRADVDLFLAPSRSLPARMGFSAEPFVMPLPAPVPVAPPGPGGPLRLLFLGALLPTKGPRIAVEAFAGLPAGAATLTVSGPPLPWAGSLAYVDALRARCAEVPGVNLVGAVARERVPELLGEADVLVFPSFWDENCPIVLLEARAAGLRIVASDVPGAAETAPDAVRVEPGSIEALRRALAAEIRRGPGRSPPAVLPTMEAHARDLLARYATLRGTS